MTQQIKDLEVRVLMDDGRVYVYLMHTAESYEASYKKINELMEICGLVDVALVHVHDMEEQAPRCVYESYPFLGRRVLRSVYAEKTVLEDAVKRAGMHNCYDEVLTKEERLATNPPSEMQDLVVTLSMNGQTVTTTTSTTTLKRLGLLGMELSLLEHLVSRCGAMGTKGSLNLIEALQEVEDDDEDSMLDYRTPLE